MAELTVAVAAHKPYWMPGDPCYLPVQAGAALAPGRIGGYQPDDEPDGGASALNGRYCELTALWWLWRNRPGCDLGLVHYRRHFAGSGPRGVATGGELEAALRGAPAAVSAPRRYPFSSVGRHYADTFDASHLEALRQAVAECDPPCLPHLERHLAAPGGHMFNMLAMRAPLAGEYVPWLFEVLIRAEGRIDLDGEGAFRQRCVGRLGELLLDPWLASRGVGFAELGRVELERPNWLRKGSAYLAARFLGRGYERSF